MSGMKHKVGKEAARCDAKPKWGSFREFTVGIYSPALGTVSAKGTDMNSYVMEGGAGLIEFMTARLLLHIDDDADEAFLLERALDLGGVSNWEFVHRSSGEEGVAYLQQAKNGEAAMPALILLDIKMPGMGGLKMLEWASASVPDVPVVILSSSGLLKDRLRARDLGSVGYYEKSATFTDVIDFLRGWENFQFRSARPRQSYRRSNSLN
jgi:CheY-like chemotaxis protein